MDHLGARRWLYAAQAFINHDAPVAQKRGVATGKQAGGKGKGKGKGKGSGNGSGNNNNNNNNNKTNNNKGKKGNAKPQPGFLERRNSTGNKTPTRKNRSKKQTPQKQTPSKSPKQKKQNNNKQGNGKQQQQGKKKQGNQGKQGRGAGNGAGSNGGRGNGSGKGAKNSGNSKGGKGKKAMQPQPGFLAKRTTKKPKRAPTRGQQARAASAKKRNPGPKTPNSKAAARALAKGPGIPGFTVPSLKDAVLRITITYVMWAVARRDAA